MPRGLSIFRVLMSIGWLGTLLIIFGYTEAEVSGLSTKLGQAPSAIQIAQVYVQGAFYAILAIGTGIALYIASRGVDEHSDGPAQ